MSTQSGISVSPELADAFKQAQADDGVRALKVVIENEQLVPSTTLPSKSTDADDFDSVAAIVREEHNDTPAYILVKLDSSSSSSSSNEQAERQWCLCSYVPDNANVRSKMLYSSTKATLTRQLGEAKFLYTLHASTPDELTSEGYKRFLKHQTSQAPMTAREREMADIKLAEGLEAEMQGTTVRRSHTGSNATTAGGAQVGMPWTEEAEEAMISLAKGDNQIVQLGIDTKDEKVVLLSAAQDTASISLPPNDPSYTFYKHDTGIVFIYCCPDTSPIRGRMIYSSNCQPIVQDAKQRGVEVVKKLETSTPSEITNEYINQECAPSRDETATPPVATGFARPTRPGRRR